SGGPAGPASDQFSFGVTFWEILSGWPPFRRATTEATIQALLHEDPGVPEILRDRASTPLAEVLRRCLSKTAEGRYENTRELAARLRAIRGERDAAAGRPLLTRRRAMWLGGATLAASAAAIATWKPWRRDTGLRSLAVLPFTNPRGDRDTQYLC